MKIRFFDIYFINLVAVIIAVVLYIILDGRPELPIALIATGISISFGIRQYKIENDKIFKELFTVFNTKYDNKFNEILNRIEQKTLTDSSYQLSNKEVALIIDYLNFCAEEYLWFQKDRIDHTVWSSWEKGMKYYFTIPSIKQLIEKERGQKDSYYGLFEKLKL